jgi:signal transduction histidine kinase
MPPPVWSTQQLAEFLTAVSSSETEASAALAAVERAAEALDAEVAAILCGGEVVAAVGYPEGAAPAAELVSVAAEAAGAALSVPGVGACPATGVALEHPPGGILLLARSGSERLSREEASLLRGMARVTSLTMRTLHLLDNERAAHEKSDRHAAENARLLGTLSERQAMLERLAEEQAALRRVATLVAGQAGADDIFAAVAEEVVRLLRADLGGVARYEPDESLTLVAEWDGGGGGLPIGTRLRLGEDIERVRVLRSGHPVRITNYERFSGPVARLARGLGIRSTIGAPIVVDGAVWGAIWASSKKPEPFPDDTESRIMGFAELVATAISNAVSRAQLAASRARVVAAADETRRRIERDLHDGIQQRLVSLGLELRAAEEGMPPHQVEAKRALARVADGLTGALDELRELARGIHPAILSEGGLGPALKALARRSAVPVELEVDVEARLPERVEVASYFVVSEALANAAKHARASVAHVNVETVDGLLHVSIRDDGVGGADPARGSGLIGLTDRVQALGGTLILLSPPGEGTTMRAELPLGND